MWLVPSVIATLTGTTVVTAVYVYLHAQERSRFMAMWSLGWFAYTLRLVMMLVYIRTEVAAFLAMNQLFALLSGVLILWGTVLFVGKRPDTRWIVAALLFSVYCVVSVGLDQSLMIVSLPTFLFQGAVYIWTGVVILREMGTRGIGAVVTGWTMILWGVHKIDYPFLRPVTWFAPVGYLLGALFALIVALGYIIIFFERTRHDLLTSQDQLTHARKMEAIGRLAGGIAHDFNNVLTTIIGYSDLLLDDQHDETQTNNGLKEIRSAAQRAARLTQQLLAFGRKQILSPQEIDLNAMLRSTNEMMQRIIGEHIQLVLNLEDKLLSVEADPGQLHQVIINLVINARDAMPYGGTVTIQTALEAPGASGDALPAQLQTPLIVMSVTDTGEGMEPEVLEHVFDPFFTTKATGKGTGLGLSSVLGIVEQSGGCVFADSSPGEGSQFRVYLPAVTDAPELG